MLLWESLIAVLMPMLTLPSCYHFTALQCPTQVMGVVADSGKVVIAEMQSQKQRHRDRDTDTPDMWSVYTHWDMFSNLTMLRVWVSLYYVG